MIFIVDDDPIQNMLAKQLISSVINANAEMKEFSNGAEVIEALEEGLVPETILLDINMPIMDGWEFLAAYKKYESQANVFMVTSSNDAKDLEQSTKFDCVKGYITKPLDITALNAVFNPQES